MSPTERWAASGGAWLTGGGGGPRDAPPGLVHLVDDRHRALVQLTAPWAPDAGQPLADLDALALLGERAALAGLPRGGEVSCGGSTRLLATADGWLALALPRVGDAELVPAWLEEALPDALLGPHLLHHPALAGLVVGRTTAALVNRAALLGLAVGALQETAHDDPVRAIRLRPPGIRDGEARAPLVVDLSSLWAGPLCSHLLALAGADVVKVESTRRPDGLRSDHSGLFDLLTAGKRSVALDLTSTTGRHHLAALVERADIVIEGSRPRALEQMGIDACRVLSAAHRKVWVSITALGRTGDHAVRTGFGDTAAVAGGLVAWGDDRPLFLGDAIADPLTGLAAAAAAAEAWLAGGTWLLDVALARVAGAATAGTRRPAPLLDEESVRRPRARVPRGPAPSLGEHTEAVLTA